MGYRMCVCTRIRKLARYSADLQCAGRTEPHVQTYKDLATLGLETGVLCSSVTRRERERRTVYSIVSVVRIFFFRGRNQNHGVRMRACLLQVLSDQRGKAALAPCKRVALPFAATLFNHCSTAVLLQSSSPSSIFISPSFLSLRLSLPVQSRKPQASYRDGKGPRRRFMEQILALANNVTLIPCHSVFAFICTCT